MLNLFDSGVFNLLLVVILPAVRLDCANAVNHVRGKLDALVVRHALLEFLAFQHTAIHELENNRGHIKA